MTDQLVDLLRQRVAAAMRGHVVALGLGNPGTDLTDALGAFEAELDDSDPADPAVQAVARALLEATECETEWAVLMEDGNVLCGDRREAEMLAFGGSGRVARRAVTYAHWQVVDTGGGEPS